MAHEVISGGTGSTVGEPVIYVVFFLMYFKPLLA